MFSWLSTEIPRQRFLSGVLSKTLASEWGTPFSKVFLFSSNSMQRIETFFVLLLMFVILCFPSCQNSLTLPIVTAMVSESKVCQENECGPIDSHRMASECTFTRRYMWKCVHSMSARHQCVLTYKQLYLLASTQISWTHTIKKRCMCVWDSYFIWQF